MKFLLLLKDILFKHGNVYSFKKQVEASYLGGLAEVRDRLSTSIYKTFNDTKDLKDYNSLTKKNIRKPVSLEKNKKKVLQTNYDKSCC